MPNSFAAASAFFKSRDAIAVISLSALFCIPGITLRVAIDATPSTPHFTFFPFAILDLDFLVLAQFSQNLSHIRCIIRALAAIPHRGEFVHAPLLAHHS